MDKSMFDFLDALLQISFLAGGVYSLFTGIQMARWDKLRDSKFIYPTNCKPADCTDPAGFRGFIRPRLLLFGVFCLLTAVCSFFASFVPASPGWLVWAAFGLGVGAVALYASAIRRAYTRFW